MAWKPRPGLEGNMMMDCPYCQNERVMRGIYGNSDLLRCPDCGLIFRYSKILADGSQQRDFEQDHLIHKQDQMTGRRNNVYRHVLEVLSSQKRGRLLDVGTGCGFFLSAAQEDGWQAIGLDPSKNAAQFARDVNHLNVIEGTLSSLEPSYPFDVVTFINVLDLMDTSPWQDVLKAHEILSSGGRLYIRIPNGQILIYLMGVLHKLGLQRYLPKLIVFHKFTYTHRFIRKMLSDIGFRDIKILSSPVSKMTTELNNSSGGLLNNLYAKLVNWQRICFKNFYLSTSLDIVATK